MWICKTHVKEALGKFNTPHFNSVPKGVGMKCTLCTNSAAANMYYTHQPLSFRDGKRTILREKTS
jgi:hypothetical protein